MTLTDKDEISPGGKYKQFFIFYFCVFYLCTVWEATRKDMRSPGDISLLDINVPPAKIVPSTMPESAAHNTTFISILDILTNHGTLQQACRLPLK